VPTNKVKHESTHTHTPARLLITRTRERPHTSSHGGSTTARATVPGTASSNPTHRRRRPVGAAAGAGASSPPRTEPRAAVAEGAPRSVGESVLFKGIIRHSY
jgi:hypothetical protein